MAIVDQHDTAANNRLFPPVVPVNPAEYLARAFAKYHI